MVAVTEQRDSGIELLDTEIEEMGEGADAVHFRVEESVQIQISESAGNPVYVDAQYFIAASIDREADEVTKMMTGQDYIDESSVFISNEDAEVGGGFIQVDEGEIEDALEQFEEEHL